MVIQTDPRISATIRAEIARAGRTQKDVYLAAGFNWPKWRNRMNGHDWRVADVRAVAAELGIPVTRLLGEDNP